MLRIEFNTDDDRAAVFDYAFRHRECGVLTLNMAHNRMYQVPVALLKMQIPATTTAWQRGTFDLDVEMMHIRRVGPVEVPDDVAVLKAQLAARDAALTAVLDLASNPKHSQCDSPDVTIVRRQLADLLTKHGVHK